MRVNGEATELGHEVRAGTHFKINGGSADDCSAFRVFGHKQQAVVRVDEPGELVFVVVSGTVIGAVTSEKDVAHGANIFRGGLAYGDHDFPSTGDAWSSGDASSRRTSRAERSVMRAICVCSFSACAPSPTAPSPSRVAVYRLVVLPSEAPPTEACSSSKPICRPRFCARCHKA